MGEGVTLGPVKKIPSLRETVTRSLRAAIVTGQMLPGEVYSAPALAAQFEVSATPVREAMVDLAREGLVEAVPNKDFRVTTVSDTELDDIAGLRRLIEPPTVRAVTAQIPDDAMGHLRDLAQAIVDHAAAGDLIAYTEAERRFHQAILGDVSAPARDLVVIGAGTVEAGSAPRPVPGCPRPGSPQNWPGPPSS